MTNEIEQMISLLKGMDKRLSALESGKKDVAVEQPVELSPTERICQSVRKDLETKQLVKLSHYGSGVVLRWVKDELQKDGTLRVIAQGDETYIIKEIAQKTPSLVVVGRGQSQDKAKRHRRINSKDRKSVV